MANKECSRMKKKRKLTAEKKAATSRKEHMIDGPSYNYGGYMICEQLPTTLTESVPIHDDRILPKK